MAHKMLNIGVNFDIKTVNTDRSGLTNLSQVVAHQIHQHSVLSTLFLALEHGRSVGFTFLRGTPSRAGSFDWRGRNGVFITSEQ